jgi:serine/threonine protein kinase
MESVRNGYTFIKLLGTGLYGKVWLIQDNVSGERYACKEVAIDPILSGLETYREIDVVSRINHHNIIKYKSIFFDISTNSNEKAGFYVMTLADETLQELLSRKNISSDEQLRFIYEIFSAVYCLHQGGIYHCDIKPDNILIKDDYTLLSDLGLAYYIDSIKGNCATIDYSSPENLFISYGDKYEQLRKYSDKYGYPSTLEDLDYDTVEIWELGILTMFITKKTKGSIWSVEGDVIPEILSFISNEKEYFNKLGINERYHPLLLRMLDPDQNTRIKSIDECLRYDVFEENSYSSPIPGTIINRGLLLVITSNNDYNIVVQWISDVLVDSNCLAVTYFCAVDLFYRCISSGLSKEYTNLQAIGCSVILLSTNLHEAEGGIPAITLSEDTEDSVSTETIIDITFNVLLRLKGILNVKTLYDYAFSKQSLKEGYLLTLDCSSYKDIDPKFYMMMLESKETTEERESRENKTFILLEDLIK